MKACLRTEMDNHLSYEPYERSSNSNARNGLKSKTVRSKYGEIEIDVPQDRESSFEPQIVKKGVRRIFLILMIR